MLRNKAIHAHYDRERKALVIDFADGSAGIWPEMVKFILKRVLKRRYCRANTYKTTCINKNQFPVLY